MRFWQPEGMTLEITLEENELITNLTNVGQDYHDLYRLSLNARYRGVSYTPHRIDEIKNGPFHRVKEEMLALLPK